MFNPKLLAKIRALYGLSDDLAFSSRVEAGFIAENFVLKSNEVRYFLKKYRDFSLDRLREVHTVKSFFAQKGIPVILPLQSEEGTFFPWHGSFYSLFPYVEGKHFERLALSDTAYANCGKLLATIHSQSKHGCPDIMKARPFQWNKVDFLRRVKKLQANIKRIENKTRFDTKTEKFLALKVLLAQQNNVTSEKFGLHNDHLIHGDYYEGNMFFGPEDEVLYLFDWEKANRAPRVIDLAYALEFLCFYGYYEEKNFHNAQVFLEAYNSVYSINIDELKKGLNIWYLYQIHNLWFTDEHYFRDNRRVDEFLDNTFRYLKYQASNFKEFSDRVCFLL